MRMKPANWMLAAVFAFAFAAGVLALSSTVSAAPPESFPRPPTGPLCNHPCRPFVRFGDLVCPFVGCFTETGECAYRC